MKTVTVPYEDGRHSNEDGREGDEDGRRIDEDRRHGDEVSGPSKIATIF